MITLSTTKDLPKTILEKSLTALQDGGVLVYPTDTVYGLLADATNEEAVKKLIRLKERPAGRAISVFVSDIKMLKTLVHVDKEMESRLTALLPGPYTIVLESLHKTSGLLESEDKTLGVRLVKDDRITELVSKFGKPVTATSANLSGTTPHYSLEAFLKTISKKKSVYIDLVLDGGKLPRNKPSTVLDMTRDRVKIIREGDKTFSANKSIISKSEADTRKVAQDLVHQIKDGITVKAAAIIIKGDLGAGKTVFVKGVGDALELADIVSPTYVIMNEYDVEDSKVKTLAHYDLYNIQDPSEFAHIGIKTYLKPGNLICIEWGEKAGQLEDLMRAKATLIYVYIRHVDKNSREITINYH